MLHLVNNNGFFIKIYLISIDLYWPFPPMYSFTKYNSLLSQARLTGILIVWPEMCYFLMFNLITKQWFLRGTYFNKG